MLTTTMKVVEKFSGDIPPSEVAETFRSTLQQLLLAFGKAGNVKMIKFDEDTDGDRVLVAIVEVED